MTQFSELGLAKPLLAALHAKGYTSATPIQAQAIPPLLQGRDLCGIAQTGTGKTAAFALPSIQFLMENPKPRTPLTCRMLVLSPTRELAAQIAQSFRDYGKQTQIRIETVFGGVPIGKQIKALSPGIDVLVATPGRLLDLIDQRALSLRNVEIFVLDEADQMLDLGFIHALKRIDTLLPKQRQSLFFSATMPKTIADLGSRFLKDPVRVSVAPQATTAERIRQFVTFCTQREKQALLTIRLQEEEIDRALVFTRTKHGANKLVTQLEKDGITCMAIHGNKSQTARTKALADFKAGKLTALIATDIAALGIDIDQLPHVVNYDLPNVSEDYVHRIGRTGRAGSNGVAVSLVCVDEHQMLKDIERLIKQKLPQEIIAGFEPDPNAIAQPIQLRSQQHQQSKKPKAAGSTSSAGAGARHGKPSAKHNSPPKKTFGR
jgi:ATP-dependent RNA helicase RhlE